MSDYIHRPLKQQTVTFKKEAVNIMVRLSALTLHVISQHMKLVATAPQVILTIQLHLASQLEKILALPCLYKLLV